MNCICDDNDIRNFRDLNSLIYPIPDCKEFSLSTDDVDYIMDSLPNKTVVQVNMCNKHNNVIFNTGVRKNYS